VSATNESVTQSGSSGPELIEIDSGLEWTGLDWYGPETGRDRTDDALN
jgi:hypothetical protein